jgi:small basic protein (TIGR04137 family)
LIVCEAIFAGIAWVKIPLFIPRSVRIVPALSEKLFHHFMSQHRSLKGQSTITAKRNVLKRFERVEILKSRGQFKVGDKVLGLRKTKPNE